VIVEEREAAFKELWAVMRLLGLPELTFRGSDGTRYDVHRYQKSGRRRPLRNLFSEVSS
jgi:hypothetical protein